MWPILRTWKQVPYFKCLFSRGQLLHVVWPWIFILRESTTVKNCVYGGSLVEGDDDEGGNEDENNRKLSHLLTSNSKTKQENRCKNERKRWHCSLPLPLLEFVNTTLGKMEKENQLIDYSCLNPFPFPGNKKGKSSGTQTKEKRSFIHCACFFPRK